MPNVATNFFTNDKVWGVITVSETAPEFSKAIT